MITSERQYGISRGWIERFEESIAGLGRTPGPGDALEPEKRAILIRSQESLLEDLRAEVAEYERLRAGTLRRKAVGGLDEVPDALVTGRIAAGLTQKQLAERMGLKEQQIQRYEATRYRSASLARVQEVVSALGLTFRGDVRFPVGKARGGKR